MTQQCESVAVIKMSKVSVIRLNGAGTGSGTSGKGTLLAQQLKLYYIFIMLLTGISGKKFIKKKQ